MTTNSDQPRAILERPTGTPDSLSGHITENIENIAAFQLREQQKVGDSQRRLGSIGNVVGRPGYLLFLLSLIVLWIVVNCLGPHIGWPLPPDPPPFAWLQGFLTLVGVLTTTVVLVAQNRQAFALQQHTDTAKVLSALETVVSGAESKAPPEAKA